MTALLPDPVLAQMFAELGDPTRLARLARLGDGGSRSIATLAGATRISRQAVTKHLHILESAGLVASIRAGRESRFAVAPDGLAAARAYLVSCRRSGMPGSIGCDRWSRRRRPADRRRPEQLRPMQTVAPSHSCRQDSGAGRFFYRRIAGAFDGGSMWKLVCALIGHRGSRDEWFAEERWRSICTRCGSAVTSPRGKRKWRAD